jgi:flagellar basal-body rod protein FlgG
MAIVAMHSAATGLKALSTQIDVISNNLANVNNDGFKSSRVNFEDLFYQQMAQPGVQNNNSDTSGSGIEVGLGTRIASTQLDFTQGAPVQTNGTYDMYLDGDGFFKIKVLSGQGDGIAYTRTGKFMQDSTGALVLNLGDGYKLEPPVTIPAGATGVSISADGRVSYIPQGSTTAQQGPQIMVARFPNPSGLVQIGSNLYQSSGASGTETLGNPGTDNLAKIKQGFVEASNVDPVTELVSMIKTQRAFELNSQSIQASDQMLQQISHLRG